AVLRSREPVRATAHHRNRATDDVFRRRSERSEAQRTRSRPPIGQDPEELAFHRRDEEADQTLVARRAVVERDARSERWKELAAFSRRDLREEHGERDGRSELPAHSPRLDVLLREPDAVVHPAGTEEHREERIG